jgi:hypothetical protein
MSFNSINRGYLVCCYVEPTPHYTIPEHGLTNAQQNSSTNEIIIANSFELEGYILMPLLKQNASQRHIFVYNDEHIISIVNILISQN